MCLRECSLPCEGASAVGDELAKLHGDLAFTARVVVKGDGNLARLAAVGVLDGIRATDAAVAAAIILLSVAIAALATPEVRSRPTGNWIGNRIRIGGRAARNLVQVGVSLLQVGHEIVVVHHPHPAAVVAVAVEDFRTPGLREAGILHDASPRKRFRPFTCRCGPATRCRCVRRWVRAGRTSTRARRAHAGRSMIRRAADRSATCRTCRNW